MRNQDQDFVKKDRRENRNIKEQDIFPTIRRMNMPDDYKKFIMQVVRERNEEAKESDSQSDSDETTEGSKEGGKKTQR